MKWIVFLTACFTLAAQVSWIPHFPGDPYPPQTIAADPGRPICRARTEQPRPIPGYASAEGCHVAEGGRGRVLPRYELLTGVSAKWSSSRTLARERAIDSGPGVSGGRILLCRASPSVPAGDQVLWTAGRVIGNTCAVADLDQVLTLDPYELLLEGAPVPKGEAPDDTTKPVVRDIRLKSLESALTAEFQKEPKIALVVGISHYPEATGLSSLRYASDDAVYLAKALEVNGYKVRTLMDGQATRGIVRRSLRELSQLVKPGEGSFLFYFGGHGFAEQGKNFLATFGVTSDDLLNEGLPLSEVEQVLKDSQARRAMVFIDACRSNPIAGRSTETRSFEKLQAAQGLRVLFATREGQVSYEDMKLRHGIFSYFLGKGIEGAAAGKDGFITFRDLSDYVTTAVQEHTARQGSLQVPFEAGESSGDFLIAAARVDPKPAAGAGSDPASVAYSNVVPKGANVWRGVQDGKFYEVEKTADDSVSIYSLGNAGQRLARLTTAKRKVDKNGKQDPKIRYAGIATPAASDCEPGAGRFYIRDLSDRKLTADVEQLHGRHGSSISSCGGSFIFKIFVPFELVKEESSQ